ncbi:hypothetical protein D082_15460 [Synechocystis sp. PCC 6714]|nr:hypothetical protein D082_15460 [Synechocystis sp. PCC 6714]
MASRTYPRTKSYQAKNLCHEVLIKCCKTEISIVICLNLVQSN